MQIYEFCFVSRKQLCYCSLFRFGNIRFVFELSNKKAASLAYAKVLKNIPQHLIRLNRSAHDFSQVIKTFAKVL